MQIRTLEARDKQYISLQNKTLDLWHTLEAKTDVVAQMKEQATRDGIEARPMSSQQMLTAIDAVLSQQSPSLAGAPCFRLHELLLSLPINLAMHQIQRQPDCYVQATVFFSRHQHFLCRLLGHCRSGHMVVRRFVGASLHALRATGVCCRLQDAAGDAAVK